MGFYSTFRQTGIFEDQGGGERGKRPSIYPKPKRDENRAQQDPSPASMKVLKYLFQKVRLRVILRLSRRLGSHDLDIEAIKDDKEDNFAPLIEIRGLWGEADQKVSSIIKGDDDEICDIPYNGRAYSLL